MQFVAQAPSPPLHFRPTEPQWPSMMSVLSRAYVNQGKTGRVHNTGEHTVYGANDHQSEPTEIPLRDIGMSGATVITAGSATEAMSCLASANPNLVVSDIGMPDEDGYSLIHPIREIQPDIPALALTAYARSDDRTKAIRAGLTTISLSPSTPPTSWLSWRDSLLEANFTLCEISQSLARRGVPHSATDRLIEFSDYSIRGFYGTIFLSTKKSEII